MPERPELDYVVPILARELVGKTITALRVDTPVVLRVALRETAQELIPGAVIERVVRRAHFVIFGLRGRTDRALELAVAPMLAGRFSLDAPEKKRPADLALSIELSDGRELRYRDDVQMGKAYVIEAGQWAQVPGLAKVGVDVLDRKAFTRPAFRALCQTRRDQAKVFLMDKSALDSMGNAYADEALFEAKVHPKTFVRSLSPAQIDQLHDAIVTVIAEATAEVAKRAPPLDEKVRDFLKVRNRHGKPCPRCGATIRKAGVHGHDAFFCPECQPDGRGSAIVDFRRIKGKDEGS
ncbi:MAG: DNA-formamidopyrimidine glycosylase family protein [Minicystis sp.]